MKQRCLEINQAILQLKVASAETAIKYDISNEQD